MTLGRSPSARTVPHPGGTPPSLKDPTGVLPCGALSTLEGCLRTTVTLVQQVELAEDLQEDSTTGGGGGVAMVELDGFQQSLRGPVLACAAQQRLDLILIEAREAAERKHLVEALAAGRKL
eukprot:CAMPEP_0202366688 /NCGR_PEP_ID=MMETSP1126-20121109/17201_1 /ASSEMBLY_ACC=CAM_ASM_000457 /TAXON_ID=3047 /ORGANISM="Dunaliella tertiolecta, Strain CCMP1320" /LENGTH=120 /DNA_ID=CAMNT_0048961791 /DNA_START=791 /DNA_END=1153 /DNA_ORIENTATION=+